MAIHVKNLGTFPLIQTPESPWSFRSALLPHVFKNVFFSPGLMGPPFHLAPLAVPSVMERTPPLLLSSPPRLLDPDRSSLNVLKTLTFSAARNFLLGIFFPLFSHPFFFLFHLGRISPQSLPPFPHRLFDFLSPTPPPPPPGLLKF